MPEVGSRTTRGLQVSGVRPLGRSAAASETPRPGACRLTPDRSSSIAEIWPEVARRLGVYARKRASSAEQAEDVVQEVAARLLSHDDVTYEDVDDLLRWCQRVARNLLIDEHRASAQRSALPLDEHAFSRPAAVDVAHEVEQRQRLRRVSRYMAALSARDQELLRAAAFEDHDIAQFSSAGSRDVARHRARRRLLEALGGAYGVAPWWRRIASKRRASATALVGVCVPLALSAAVYIGTVGSPASDGFGAGIDRSTTPEQGLSATTQTAVVLDSSDPRTSPHSRGQDHGRHTPPPRAQTMRLGSEGPGISVTEYEPSDSRLICAGGLPVVREEHCVDSPRQALEGLLPNDGARAELITR